MGLIPTCFTLAHVVFFCGVDVFLRLQQGDGLGFLWTFPLLMELKDWISPLGNREFWLLSGEDVAGLFSNGFGTFPLSAIAAGALVFNWQTHRTVLNRSLSARHGKMGTCAFFLLMPCSVAAICKPLIYFALPTLQLTEAPPEVVFHCTIAIDALSLVFEYLLGITLQLWIILRCDLWIRGTNLREESTLDFVLRRLSAILRWAIVLVLITFVLVQLPLIAANLGLVPSELVFNWVENWARPLITLLMLGSCSVQAALAFHADRLRPALRHHAAWFKKNWVLACFFIVAALAHLAALNLALDGIKRSMGDALSFTNVAFLLVNGIKAFCFVWLLCSWVCFFRRTQRRIRPDEQLVRY